MFCMQLGQKYIRSIPMPGTHGFWEVGDHSRSKKHETLLIITHDTGIRPSPELNQGPLDQHSDGYDVIKEHMNCEYPEQ